MTKVVIDSREQSRITSATQYYENQGYEVEVTELPIGDYIFNNQVCFEYKTIPDFISSIQSGRVFNQDINMAENYDYHYVIIQGDEHTRSRSLGMSRNYIPVNITQYLGAIASLNRFTTVIESYNPIIEEAYYRMQITAHKALMNKPLVKKFPKKHRNPALNFLCYSIYGINYKKAQVIVDTYELESLDELFELTKEKLLNIEGIGEKTAQNIIEAIHGSQD
jgi:ERCC4-type nuclease